ncbi:hypothetical protein MASR2M79_11150 [Aminivibrio sp.]
MHKSRPHGPEPLSVERVTDADCISCGRCTEACPVEKTPLLLRTKKVLSALAVGCWEWGSSPPTEQPG